MPVVWLLRPSALNLDLASIRRSTRRVSPFSRIAIARFVIGLMKRPFLRSFDGSAPSRETMLLSSLSNVLVCVVMVPSALIGRRWFGRVGAIVLLLLGLAVDNICDVLMAVSPLRAQFSARVLDWIGIVLSLYIETENNYNFCIPELSS